MVHKEQKMDWVHARLSFWRGIFSLAQDAVIFGNIEQTFCHVLVVVDVIRTMVGQTIALLVEMTHYMLSQ